jgi:hypothetical protein
MRGNSLTRTRTMIGGLFERLGVSIVNHVSDNLGAVVGQAVPAIIASEERRPWCSGNFRDLYSQ